MEDSRLPPATGNRFFWNADPNSTGAIEPNIRFDQRFSNVIEKALDIKWINWNSHIIYREDTAIVVSHLASIYEAQISDAPVFDEGFIYSRIAGQLQQIELTTGHFETKAITGTPFTVGNGRDTLFSIPKFEGLGAGLRGKGNLYLNVSTKTIIVIGALAQVDINFTADVWYV